MTRLMALFHAGEFEGTDGARLHLDGACWGWKDAPLRSLTVKRYRFKEIVRRRLPLSPQGRAIRARVCLAVEGDVSVGRRCRDAEVKLSRNLVD